CHTGNCALRDALLILFRYEIFALSGCEVRTVDGEERLTLAKILIRGVREDFLDVAGVPHLHSGKACFINYDIASEVDIVFNGSAFYLASLDADALLTFRRKLYGDESCLVRRDRRTLRPLRGTLGRFG